MWLLVVLAIAAIGTAGYVVLEGWSAGDALYMTVITLTTVGFREVNELDTAGRIWTMILSVAAVGIIFGTVGIVAEGILAEVASGTEGGEADGARGRGAPRPLHRVRIRPGRLDGRPRARRRRPSRS